MTLLVEDGTGITEANSYADVPFAVSMLEARGLINQPEQDPVDSTVLGQFLIQGFDFLETLCYKGQKGEALGESHFPRFGCTNGKGYTFDIDEIPPELKKAQVWAAYYIYSGNDPAAAKGWAVKKERVEGAVDITYTVGEGVKDEVRLSDLPMVYSQLKEMLHFKNTKGTIR